jgi:hypothetical protein
MPKTKPKADKSRQIKQPVYKSFKLQKRIKGEKIASAFVLMRQSWVVLGNNWKVFGGVVLLYGLLSVVLVQGFQAAGSLDETKDTYDRLFSGSFSDLLAGAGLFAYLLGTAGNTASSTAGVYQVILTVVFSLALIWTLRQVHAGHKVRIRDGFYLGMTPFVTFVLVLLVVGLELIPLAVGGALYSTVATNGIAATSVEQIIWLLFFSVLALISLYMIASSLFALYIVTLPSMTPLAALRSARQLVRSRRFAVIRKIIFLPLALIVLSGVILIPLIMFATPLAPWVFFVMSAMILPVIHSYMYSLYRALI